MKRLAAILVGFVALASCGKVPLTDVDAGFSLAEAAWFEGEETLFVFWRVDAQQGLGPESQLELSWRTDDVAQPFTATQALTTVHTHVPVDCGAKSLCGSTSVHVAGRPVEVALRLRYHRDGALTLDAPLSLHVVDAGAAHTNRSLVVYGVLDESNRRVQWRARHQFPSIRNEEAQALGLRRSFRIFDPAHGDPGMDFGGNPYGYGLGDACPASFAPLAWEPVQTMERALFDPHELPLEATASAAVCARSEVTDAKGTFQAVAFARKNPEVAPAFPKLRSPIRTNTQLGFRLHPCRRTISEPHRAMQDQRLLLDGAPEICLDDWDTAAFRIELIATLRARIDAVRSAGNDMVLLLALHHDAGEPLAHVIEGVLEEVLQYELQKSSPHVSGAFVFDSLVHEVKSPAIRRLVLWCPANRPEEDLETIPSNAERTCAIQPDLPNLAIGPFSFANLPILPTRAQYLKFIDKYSEAEAGKTTSLTFLSPQLTPLTEHVPVGEFGVATFFNDEGLTSSPGEAFSFCQSEDPRASAVVFRVAGFPDPIPLSKLPEVQATAPQARYGLGLLWDFPYLLRLEYETVVAGAASAYGFSIPFGLALPSKSYYGTQLWQSGEIDLSAVLLRCARFCEQPTFDSAGVYNVGQPFDTTYAQLCYRPLYPKPGDGGFPRDP